MVDRIDQAERLGRRRARLLVIVGLLLLTQQVSYFVLWNRAALPLRTVELVYLAGWVFLALACLFALTTGGGYGYGPQVRALVNDESARANRASALAAGFGAAMLTGVALFVVASLEPTDARLALHLVVTIGLAAALLRFGALERRGYRSA